MGETVFAHCRLLCVVMAASTTGTRYIKAHQSFAFSGTAFSASILIFFSSGSGLVLTFFHDFLPFSSFTTAH